MISSKKSELIDGYSQIQIRKKNGLMIQNIPKRADTDTARILQYLSSNPRSTLSELSEVVGIKKRNTWEDYRQTPG